MKIIILAGGSGTRLWPLSRPHFPKQLVSLDGKRSLLQETCLRFLAGYPARDILTVTEAPLAGQIAIQLAEIDPQLAHQIVVEPARKGTTFAILSALKWLDDRGEGGDACLVTPSDHVIWETDRFLEKVELAKEVVDQGEFVLLGVAPTSAHPGYGYIKFDGSHPVGQVEKFIEKPNKATASSFLAEGNVLWNSGIFLFPAHRFEKEFSKRQPAMFDAFKRGNIDQFSPLSIDSAFLEKTSDLRVIPLDVSWSDVGSWEGVFASFNKDKEGNVKKGEVIDIGMSRSLVFGGKRPIVAIGIEDLLVVDADEALLIAKQGSSHQVGAIAPQLEELLKPIKIERPWGHYVVLEEKSTYKVKRITVIPGGTLSLQYHLHRSEHWVVTMGTAHVILGEQESVLSENGSLFIPKLLPHRLSNRGDTLLEMIEVQMGDYVGEDDIVRLEDVYGRIEQVAKI